MGIQHPPCGCSAGSIHTTSVRPFSPCRLERIGFAHQGAEEAPERVALVGEDTGDVFPHDDALVSSGANMVNCICKLHEFYGECAALAGQAFAHASDREILAWSAADKDQWRGDDALQNLAGQLGHVAQVGNGRPAVSQHSRREGLDLSEPASLKAQALPGN
ncbi:hypothetical protein A7D27_24440 [Pseudomonas sp. 1D4]|nr:hypothetical protein A7D27_24440 [Pseudomonas sp. 1D4]